MIDPPTAAALPETLEAIANADLITIGPGSLYTSLITNLLVQGIPSALATARGLRVYICNLMSQANESLNLTASQHIENIYEHARAPIFDYAIVNHFAVLARHALPLRRRRRQPHRSRHRPHRSPGRQSHRRQLRPRRNRSPPQRRQRHRRVARVRPCLDYPLGKLMDHGIFCATIIRD